MNVTDELLQKNAAYTDNVEKGPLPLPPAKGVASGRLHGRPPERLREAGAPGGRRTLDPERRRGDNGRRDPVPNDQPAPAGEA
jgi:hypothetical protein